MSLQKEDPPNWLMNFLDRTLMERTHSTTTKYAEEAATPFSRGLSLSTSPERTQFEIRESSYEGTRIATRNSLKAGTS